MTPNNLSNDSNKEVREIMFDKNNFHLIVDGINNGEKKWLYTVPAIADVIEPEQSNLIMNALIHSLIISPSDTLDVLKKMDEETLKKGHSLIRDKFGTGTICTYMVNTDEYDRQSFFSYYSQAQIKLEPLGEKGKECLELMNASVEETIYDEAHGKLIWGNKEYPF